MKLDFELDPSSGDLTEDQLKHVCSSIDGDVATISYITNKDRSLSYGDFIVTASWKTLEKIENCTVYIVSTNKDYIEDKDVVLTFKCIVIFQTNDQFQIAHLVSDSEDEAGFTPKLEVRGSTPVLVFLEQYEGYMTNYAVDIDPDDASSTLCYYSNVEEKKKMKHDFFLN